MTDENEEPADKLECMLNGWKYSAESGDGIDPTAGIETIIATAFAHACRGQVLVEMIRAMCKYQSQELRDRTAASLAKAELEADQAVTDFIKGVRKVIEESIDADT